MLLFECSLPYLAISRGKLLHLHIRAEITSLILLIKYCSNGVNVAEKWNAIVIMSPFALMSFQMLGVMRQIVTSVCFASYTSYARCIITHAYRVIYLHKNTLMSVSI